MYYISYLYIISNSSTVNKIFSVFWIYFVWMYVRNMVWQAREKIISKIKKIIEVHRQEGASQVDNGVLGRLLKEESLPDDAVPDFIINLLFAGNETTSKTMLFAVYFLTHCPKAMKQLLVRVCVYIYIYILMENFTYYSLCFINYFCN
jgi:hypothetical protein